MKERMRIPGLVGGLGYVPLLLRADLLLPSGPEAVDQKGDVTAFATMSRQKAMPADAHPATPSANAATRRFTWNVPRNAALG